MAEGHQGDRQHQRGRADGGHRAKAHAEVDGQQRREGKGGDEAEDGHVDPRPRHRLAAQGKREQSTDGADGEQMQPELPARVPERAVPADVDEDRSRRAES